MKIPSKNTCAYAVCKIIYTQGGKTTGELTSALVDRFVRNTIIDKIAEMVSNHVLVREGDQHFNAVPITRHFEQCEIDLLPKLAPLGNMATPREARPFRPLTSYKLPRDGAREGADDHRKHKSRHF